MSKHPYNIKKTWIFNYIRAQVCEQTQGGRLVANVIYHRGDVGGLLSTAYRAVLKAVLMPEFADISLVRGDNSNAQSGRAAISSCFSRSGRSSVSSNGVLALKEKQRGRNGCKQLVPWLIFVSIFSIIHRFCPPNSSHWHDALSFSPVPYVKPLGSRGSCLTTALLCF